jgi:FkbM family methyltransferase
MLNGLRRWAAESRLRSTVLHPAVRRAGATLLSVRFLPAVWAVRRPGIFLIRTLITRSGLAAYRLRGSDVWVVARHGTGALELLYEVFRNRCYDLPAAVVAKPHPRILDLGANVGAFAAYVLTRAPHAEIVCVEPDRENLAALARFRELNPWASVQVVPACAAVADGTVSFVEGLGSGSHVGEGGSESPAIDVFPLFEWADYVKMDIERSEWPILEDARLAGVGPVALAMEYHRRRWQDRGAEQYARALLEKAGFEVVRCDPNYWGHGLIWALALRPAGTGEGVGHHHRDQDVGHMSAMRSST